MDIKASSLLLVQLVLKSSVLGLNVCSAIRVVMGYFWGLSSHTENPKLPVTALAPRCCLSSGRAV